MGTCSIISKIFGFDQNEKKCIFTTKFRHKLRCNMIVIKTLNCMHMTQSRNFFGFIFASYIKMFRLLDAKIEIKSQEDITVGGQIEKEYFFS